MKDEVHGTPVQEFVGLRPKMYSLLYNENGKTVEKKVAKGIAKNVTKREVRHEHYKECLFNRKQQTASMQQIRSFKHNLYTINLNKIGLSCDTLAHGHYSIRDSNLDQYDYELMDLLTNL